MNTQRLADIIADPTALSELQKCTSVSELVTSLNQAGAECTREEGLRFLRAWENIAAEDEEMDLEEMDQVAGGGITSGIIGFIKSFFLHDTPPKDNQVHPVRQNLPTIDKLLAHMKR